MSKQRGITLIALIVTIIVLLILAGVTIATLTGDNGLLTKATEAKKASENANLEEEVQLALVENEADKYFDSNSSIEDKLKAIFEKNYGTGNITVTKSGKNYKVKVKDTKTVYRIKYDGSVEKYEEMNTTSMYAKLDDNGTLHLRATKYDDDYKLYSSSDSIQSNWNTANNATKSSITKVIIEEPIAPVSAQKMFWDYNKLTNIENIQNLHTENIVDMGSMFQGCSLLEYLDVSKFDTEKVKSMLRMFNGCGAQNFLDLSGFNTSNVTSMYMMFYGCKSEDIDASGFDTSKVTDMEYMFASTKCKSLDLRHFKTDNVTSMFAMFFSCSQLEKLDLSGKFSINTGTNITHMFTDINRNIKITSSEDTKNKILEIFPRLENNFNN